MTESEWLACEDPQAMLTWLQYGLALGSKNPDGTQNILTGPSMPSERKLRLFVEACRLRWPDLAAKTDLGDQGRLMQAVAQWGLTKECVPASKIANFLRDIVGNPFRPVMRVGKYWGMFVHHDKHILLYKRWLTPTVLAIAQAAYDERREDSSLDPVTLGVLADALEDAGCPGEEVSEEVVEYCDAFMYGCEEFGDNWRETCTHKKMRKVASRTPHPILAHLRSPGPHVRGCWALDLILGKE